MPVMECAPRSQAPQARQIRSRATKVVEQGELDLSQAHFPARSAVRSPVKPPSAPRVEHNQARQTQPQPADHRPPFPPRTFDFYFRPKRFESETLYRCLGVGVFKDVLMATVGRMHRWLTRKTGEGTNYTLGGHRYEDLKRFERDSRFNESIHLWCNIGCLGTVIGYALTGSMPPLFTTAIAALNIYCCAAQRYHRLRLERAVKLAERRPGGTIPSFRFED